MTTRRCPICGETRFEDWSACPACDHPYPDDSDDDDDDEDDDEDEDEDELDARARAFERCADDPDVQAPCPACSDVGLRSGTLDELFHSMRELVDGLHVRRCVFAVIDDEHPYRYTQVLADRDGALAVEVSSTEATDDGSGSAALTPAMEHELMRLRFAPPDASSPNWHRVFAEPWPWPAPVVAELLVLALVWVLGTDPHALVVRCEHAMKDVSVVPDDETFPDRVKP